MKEGDVILDNGHTLHFVDRGAAEDRMVPVQHGEWLAAHCPGAQFWRLPHDGHISVLSAAPRALDWLREPASA